MLVQISKRSGSSTNVYGDRIRWNFHLNTVALQNSKCAVFYV